MTIRDNVRKHLFGISLFALALAAVGPHLLPDARSQIINGGGSGGGTPYPTGAFPALFVQSGTTGIVTATINGIGGRLTYLCGIEVSSTGGTASSGPVTINGASGVVITVQLPVNPIVPYNRTFTPCLVSASTGINISASTTANATATAVNVTLNGFTL